MPLELACLRARLEFPRLELRSMPWSAAALQRCPGRPLTCTQDVWNEISLPSATHLQSAVRFTGHFGDTLLGNPTNGSTGLPGATGMLLHARNSTGRLEENNAMGTPHSEAGGAQRRLSSVFLHEVRHARVLLLPPGREGSSETTDGGRVWGGAGGCLSPRGRSHGGRGRGDGLGGAEQGPPAPLLRDDSSLLSLFPLWDLGSD